MRMVRMEDLGAAMHQAVLRRIPQVGTGNGGGRISKGIRAIPHGFVLKAEILVLLVHRINAERLAAIVQRAATGTIGIGQRVTLGEEVALLVDRAERLIANFMVDNHELAEIRAGAVLDDRLPPARHLGGLPFAQWIKIFRPARLHHESPEEAHHRQLAVIAVGMELPAAFLGAGVNVPLHVRALALGHDGIGICGRRRLAGPAHDHAGTMDMQAHGLAALQGVPQDDLHAVTLIAPDHQRLDVVSLDAVGHRSRIELILLVLPPGLVLGLFRADFFKILREDVHVAGIKIEPLIQADFHIDGRNVVLLDRRRGGATTARCRHGFGRTLGGQ